MLRYDTHSFTARDNRPMRTESATLARQIKCYFSHQTNKKFNKQKQWKREKRQRASVSEAGICFQNWLGRNKMISYELSYELRRGEESLERKTEDRQLAELFTFAKRGRGRTSEEERGRGLVQ